MRLTYLAIPFMAVLLAACGDEERDIDTYDEPVPTTDEYDLPDEPATMPSSPATTTPPPGDEDAGLDTEGDANSSDLTEPDTVQGTGAIH